MQCRRNRQARQRACRQYRCNPVLLVGVFEHDSRQLLDEQRHAVGTLDDLGNDFASQWRVAGELANQSGHVALGKPIERQQRDLRLAGPALLELGAEGHY